MKKPFIYGMSVEGENFTDREVETARLRKDFEHGINIILISPRRMGKTSLVKNVCKQITDPSIQIVLMDVYDCRSEYDFYNRFASAILKETSNKMEQVLDNIKKFLVRVSPKISFSPEPNSDYSISLGITPQVYSPEEILSLPEKIAEEKNKHIIICIDEFQQIGEFSDTLTVQKRMRGIWQHQQHVSYCLFGSKKHLMTNLFQNKRMPFYQFGEMNELSIIPTEKWIPFIQSRFADNGQKISDGFARKICETVGNYSSYVQQLAWDVMVETDKEVKDEDFNNGLDALFAQCTSYFQEQIRGLSTYQMNFIRTLCSGVHDEFGNKDAIYALGSKSNVSRIKAALTNKELIIDDNGKCFLADCVFERWFKRECM